MGFLYEVANLGEFVHSSFTSSRHLHFWLEWKQVLCAPEGSQKLHENVHIDLADSPRASGISNDNPLVVRLAVGQDLEGCQRV